MPYEEEGSPGKTMAEINDAVVQLWHNRLIMGRTAREIHFDERAQRNTDYFAGKQNQEDTKEGRVPLNFVWSLIKVFVPAVYSRNPRPMIRPKLTEAVPPEVLQQKRRLARMFEILVSKTMDEINLKKTMKMIVQDSALTGRGFIKLGYDAQKGKMKKKKYQIAKQKEISSGVPIDANMEDEYVKEERVWAKRISPFRFFYDPEAASLDSARWCVHEVVVPLTHAKNNPAYGNKAKDLKASTIVDKQYLSGIEGSGGYEGDMDVNSAPDDVKRVVLCEIWDKESRSIRVIAKGNEDLGFLRDDPWPYEKVEGFPFVELVFNPVPDSQWAISEVDNIIDGQDEMNLLRDHMATHFKRTLAIMMANKVQVDAKDLEKINNSELDEIIPVSGDPRTALSSFISAGLSQEHLTRDRILKSDMEENSGIPSWKRAGQRIGARSATEVAEISQGLDVKDNEKVDVVQDFTRDVLRKMVQIMQETYRIEHVIPVAGELGLEWRPFTVQDVKEELDVAIVPYSASPVTPDSEKNQYLQFLQLIMPIAQMAPGAVDIMAMIRKVGQKLQITDLDEILPQPQEQQAAPGGGLGAITNPGTPMPGYALRPGPI